MRQHRRSAICIVVECRFHKRTPVGQQWINKKVLSRHDRSRWHLVFGKQINQLGFGVPKCPLPQSPHVFFTMLPATPEGVELGGSETVIADEVNQRLPVSFRVNQRDMTVSAFDDRPLSFFALPMDVLTHCTGQGSLPVHPAQHANAIDDGSISLLKTPPLRCNTTECRKDAVANSTYTEISIGNQRCSVGIAQQISKAGGTK